MKGAHPEGVDLRAEQLADALSHLACGLVGEGDGQQVLGRNSAHPDQIGDAVRQYAGLAAACAREHEDRAFGRLHGLALLGVESLENRFGKHVRIVSSSRRQLASRRGGVRRLVDRATALNGSRGHSTVTLFARLRGWSTSVPFCTATW
jgi:hypothetical protein